MSRLVEGAMKLSWLCCKSFCRNTVLTALGAPDFVGMMGDFKEVIDLLSDFTTEEDLSTFADVFNKAIESTTMEDLSGYDVLIELANQNFSMADDEEKNHTKTTSGSTTNENSSESEQRIRQELVKILMIQRKLQEKKIAAIVVSSKFINSSDVMDLTISKKFMRSELTVTDVNNHLIMKVQSDKFVSLRHRRTLFDRDGNPVVHINKKLATIHGRWQVFKGETDDTEKLLYEVKKCNMIQFTNEYKVILAGNIEEEKCDYLIEHVNNKAGTYSIKNIGHSNEIIAQIHRKSKTDAYGVTIYPFVDYAFVISLIAILYIIDN